jgi:hypothetical protein
VFVLFPFVFLIETLIFPNSVSVFLSTEKMFAETGLLFPYLQNYSQEFQQLEEYCMTQKFNASMVPSISLSFFYFQFL